MALGSKVVDLCRLYFINDLHKAGTVSEVTIVQLHVSFNMSLGVLIQMFNSTCIE